MKREHRSQAKLINKIAVVRALYLGDLLLAIPALRLIHHHYPAAEITFIGLPWARSFIQRFPYVDRFLEFPGYPGLPEVAVEPDKLRSFLAYARAYVYDLAIQAHGSGRVSNRFVAELGARWTVGFANDRESGSLLTTSIPYAEKEHEISKWLRLARAAGCSGGETRLEFPLTEEDRREIEELGQARGFSTANRLVAFHVGAKHPARRWPLEYWGQLADDLAQRLDARIVLTGSQEEGDLTARVAQIAQAPLIDVAGQTSLGGLAALLARVDLFISGDSGPAHLAEAVGAKTLRLFGPTDPARWGPLDQRQHKVIWRQASCSPCAYTSCPNDQQCLISIRPSQALSVATQLLAD